MAALNFVQQTFQSERPLEVSTAEDKEAFRMLRRAKSMHDMDPTGHCSEARVLPTGSPDLKPRKMHNLRLCDIQWEALANRREQRRVLNLRGLPTKLCTTEALHAWLRAGGLGDTVEDLKVFPGKAGRLGCAVVRAREVADVESLENYFMAANLRLCDIQWEALANRREQRRVLNLRGLPTKLCTTEALNAWLRAGGLGDTVEDLKVFPGKAGRLGCAVVRAREAADVESLENYFMAASLELAALLLSALQPQDRVVQRSSGQRQQRSNLPSGRQSSLQAPASSQAPSRWSNRQILAHSLAIRQRKLDSSSSAEGSYRQGCIFEAAHLRLPSSLECLHW
eukprot:CAMPEP_0172928848 /NCGR_PEP_ID=MMETSP1075-20121228/218118_1 /TAXON_ID=2916 /ORGANISM="Ceratium fusus, Strain PA161109" /LENGTH=338 /DNA_ID=CAMNT_0013790135 /DNA_START=86 /DNA_END=1107 /DNA_ORIENTATION=-